ncbi:hypothetical protein SBF1_340019 [Candidatus Desulfosporosinus infrequens]|uniref:Uncharacterized protein n=1 Tax=Candidatus Desulfosporosinus infrequens TaxID=2043169 RepID=A0A2U3L1L7_9FIRM|nr:hypothetical protein SBF1_340019 [Candidatus Desulfosporosinus infrequens]
MAGAKRWHGWPSVPEAMTRARMFEVRTPPWMARCRDGKKGPSGEGGSLVALILRKYITQVYTF